MVHSKGGRERGKMETQVGTSHPGDNMAGQNVNNSGQANMSSPSQPIPDPTTVHNNSSSDLCGTCNCITGADAIGCDKCTNWFHPTSMCLGLPFQMINSIQEYGVTGIVFVCTKCRTSINNGSDMSQSAIKLLFQTVKKLCETVQPLTSQMAALTTNSGNSSRPQNSAPASFFGTGPST